MVKALTTKSWGGKTPQQQRMESEAMLAMKRDGVSAFEIAQRFNCSESSVYGRIKKCLDARIDEGVDDYRKEMRERFDQQYLALATIAFAPAEVRNVTVRARIDALAQMSNVTERVAKLYGLNKPILIEQTVTLIEGGIDAEVERLAAELGLAEVPTGDGVDLGV